MSACLIVAYARPIIFKKIFYAALESGFSKIYLSIDKCKPDSSLKKTRDNISVIETAQKIASEFPSMVLLHINSFSLGLKLNIIRSINRVFQTEDFVTVLEDDIISTKNFFEFSEWAKDKYWNCHFINHISGINPYTAAKETNYDKPFFSSFHYCWAWSTWKHKWNSNLLSISFPSKTINIFRILLNHWPSADYLDVLSHAFCLSKAVNGHLDSWAYLWGFYSIINNCFAILPPYSLISNIGFDDTSTHTKKQLYLLNNPKDSMLDFHDIIMTFYERDFEVHSLREQSILIDKWELRQRYALRNRLLRLL